MLKQTVRTITGVDDNGTSKVISKDTVETLVPYPPYPCFQIQNLFYSEENPQSLTTRHLDTPYDVDLPEGATRFMKLRMPTKKEMTTEMEKNGDPVPEDWTKFNLHNTDSIDYVYVLSGAITCVVGEELLELKAGDFLAQVGPEHTWINDNDEHCELLCVMVGIKPSGDRKKMDVE